MTLDWAYLADRGGESIESLVARWLIAKYPTARRVKPSQGDSGIDVYLEGAGGLTVWQIKKFTAPLKDGQWRQVKDSWKRFVTEHVEAGERIALYHLVTPWAPSEPALRRFESVVAGVSFPRIWWGDDHLQVLASDYPTITEMWLHGQSAFERQVQAKAMLATTDPAREERYADAIRQRRHRLDELQNAASLNYTVDSGYRSTSSPGEWPKMAEGEPAIYMRMEQLGPTRYYVESVIPNSPEAVDDEPISLTLTFSGELNDEQRERVRGWLEWGVPLRDMPAIVRLEGGPHAQEDPGKVHLGELSAMPLRKLPFSFELAVTYEDGSTRTLELELIEHTIGVRTGWVRFVFALASGLLRFEVRVVPGQPESEANDTTWAFGDTDGLELGPLLNDLLVITAMNAAASLTIRSTNGLGLLVLRGNFGAEPGFGAVRALLQDVAALAPHTSEHIVAPALDLVNDEQFQALRRIRAVLEGARLAYKWVRFELDISTDTDPDTQSEGSPLTISQPWSLFLGGRTYLGGRPLLYELESAVVESIATDGDASSPRATIAPGSSDAATIRADMDWERA